MSYHTDPSYFDPIEVDDVAAPFRRITVTPNGPNVRIKVSRGLGSDLEEIVFDVHPSVLARALSRIPGFTADYGLPVDRERTAVAEVRGGIAYNSAEEADLAAEIPTVYLSGHAADAGYVAEAVLASDWLAAHDKEKDRRITELEAAPAEARAERESGAPRIYGA